MRKTNDRYRIRLSTDTFEELYYRDPSGWVKVSSRGRRFRATAEQVLNHLLPALAGLAPGVRTTVEYRAPRGRPASRLRSPGGGRRRAPP